MLQLLQDTTIHLKAEADRLAQATSTVQQSQMQAISRKSRDSAKFLKASS